MELVLLVCLTAAPQTCHEERVRFSMEPMASHACAVTAPPLVAQWADARPALRIARWRCGVPGAEGYRI